MVAAGDDFQAVVFHDVDEVMFQIDAARPMAGQVEAQLLRLAKAGVRRFEGVLDKGVDFLDLGLVGSLPVEVVFPALGRP